MCGIACYLGSKKPAKFLIEKLKLLEYRGYDSAGVASLKNGEFEVVKAVGNISNLSKKTSDNMSITLAISHTRWATHGNCTEVNAHPHLSANQRFAVVHNGIIENYEKIKEKLNNKPQSDTDTAVAAQLFEEKNVSSLEEFVDAAGKLQGSYALVCLDSQNDNIMYFAKNKSPMFVAFSKEDDVMIASDPICFKDFAKEIIQIEDGDFGVVSRDKIVVMNQQKQRLTRKTTPLEYDFESSSKGNYPHFMLKEIFEEQKVLNNLVNTYVSRNILKPFDAKFLSRFKKIVFVGCGTAYHSGMVGAMYAKKFLGIDAYAVMASEFEREEQFTLNTNVLCFFISQSGETADTLRALEFAKSKNATTIALTNVMYSSLSKKAEFVLPICAGVEIAVASTKAYVCQISAMYLFCKNAKLENIANKNECFLDILQISQKILKFDMAKLNKFAELIVKKNNCVFIGKSLDYVSAKESSLKLMEISYLNASAYPSGELKHGYLATITAESVLVALATDKEVNIKTINSSKEAMARGANVIFVTNDPNVDFERTIFIDEQNVDLCPILCASVLQYLAYRVSILKNLNPDQPRNLAKSVTVE